ncbi:hypothetical protein Tco_1355774, partial [Tanacetum coccineum]
METIHVKFDELSAMASECNNSGPGFNCLNFHDSSEELNAIPSKEDLDNLFGSLSSIEEPISNEPTTLVLDDNADELVQEYIAEFDG